MSPIVSQGTHDPASIATGKDSLKTTCRLLRIDAATLETTLLTAVTVTRGESIRKQYNKEQAYGMC